MAKITNFLPFKGFFEFNSIVLIKKDKKWTKNHNYLANRIRLNHLIITVYSDVVTKTIF